MSNLGKRLHQARKAAALSLRALAERVGLSHMAIKKYEDGLLYPSSDILLKLAAALKVSTDFFLRPIKAPLGEVKFRKRKAFNKQAQGAIKLEVENQIERRLELESLYPEPPIAPFALPKTLRKSIEQPEEIEVIADVLREHWKLGIAPIHDLVDALEARGVRVFIVDCDNQHFDGFSATINGQPLLIISSRWPGDRQRFSLAHELAHYVLQASLPAHLDEEEACNRFAAAFLFPKEAVISEMGPKRQAVEWQELALLKEHYQLSMQAICKRLRDLRIIKEGYFKRVMMHFKEHGWLTQEPTPQLLPEKARVFQRLVLRALSEDYIGESKATELLGGSLPACRNVRSNELTSTSSATGL